MPLLLVAAGAAALPAAATPPACEPATGAPALPVNAWRRSARTDAVYVAVFEPAATARWPGNLKKYRLADGQLMGRDGPATDPATGRLRPDAWSFWSATRDGDRVDEGGAASRLPEWRDRRLYTDIAGPDLAAVANAVTADNAGLIPALPGMTDADRAALLEWARGRDALDADGDGEMAETRRELGAAPNAAPVVLDYRPGGQVVFLPTRDGYLHAFDGDTGDERWAFLPARLLPLIAARFQDPGGTVGDSGLDGSLAVHHVDRDGEPGVGPDDQALLLFGMGRGGSAVFALDVTDADRPQLLWQVDDTTPGFADLGQSWAPPAVVQLVVPGRGTGEAAALIAGGYDPARDAAGAGAATRGNAVYLVDLRSGSRLWSAGPPGATDPHDLQLPALRYPITATPRAVDLTGDGLADRFYVGDLGGQLWRFDVHGGDAGAAIITAGVLASLGAAGPGPATLPADARRFSATPDVVPLAHYGQLVLAINLGSGDAARPGDTATADAFFSVRDTVAAVRRTGDYGPPVTTTDLLDITTDLAPRLPPDTRGWRLRLVQVPGEKVLAPSLTIRNQLYFTSFAPDADGPCGTGTTRLYRVSVRDGRPLVRTTDDDGTAPVEPRSTVVGPGVPGLAPEATLVRQPGAAAPDRPSLHVCTGLACGEQPEAGAPVPTYWYPEPAPPRR
ncbi:MAG: PQQ-binding-like beta-propeller repeat protein [Chromatiales bacterium]|nr:PQQ-binding-like beta-propeller repeat protein [Chromatiales bacterium]